MLRRVLLLALAFTAGIFYLSAALAAGAGERLIFFSLVPKGTEQPFLNRLATPSQHLLVTLQPVAGAGETLQIRERVGRQLYIVEGFGAAGFGTERPLTGEVGRLGPFRMISLALGRDPHEILASHLSYGEPVANQLTEFSELGLKPLAELIREGLLLGRADKGFNPDNLRISQDFLHQKLSEFSGARPVRIGGSSQTIRERSSVTGRKQALAYLQQEYAALGFQTSTHSYGGAGGGQNFIAEKPGRESGKFFILSGHYDSVLTAGADDDGSGMIAGLAVAAALKTSQFRYGLRILGFDQEEKGLRGSQAYAAALQARGELGSVLGVIQLEMLGWDADQDGAIHVIDCQENQSATLTELFMNGVNHRGLNLQRVEACTNRSDHAAFWRYNRPAIVISENFFGGDGNPCYHRSCDRIDKINLAYYAEISMAVAQAVYELLQGERQGERQAEPL